MKIIFFSFNLFPEEVAFEFSILKFIPEDIENKHPRSLFGLFLTKNGAVINLFFLNISFY